MLPNIAVATYGSRRRGPGAVLSNGSAKSAALLKLQFTSGVAPPSSEKDPPPGARNVRLPWLRNCHRPSSEYHWTPPTKRLRAPGMRPMACPTSCRRVATRSGPAGTGGTGGTVLPLPRPMPMKPSTPCPPMGIPRAFAWLELIQKRDTPLTLGASGRFVAVKKVGWPEFSRAVLNSPYVSSTSVSPFVPPVPAPLTVLPSPG
jgi:hypothetical protein